MPYITPSVSAPSATRCRRLLIPDHPDWISIVNGALSELIYPERYEQTSGITPEETAETFAAMFWAWREDDCSEGAVQVYDHTIEPNTPLPVLLATLETGATVLEVQLSVDEPLDAGVTVTVGTMATPALLMPADANQPGYVAVYSTTPAIEFFAPSEVYLFISGAFTVGKCRVYLTVEED